MRSRSAGAIASSMAVNRQPPAKSVGFAIGGTQSQKAPVAAVPHQISSAAAASSATVRPKKTVNKNGSRVGLNATGRPVGSGTTMVRKAPGKMTVVPWDIGQDLKQYGSMEDVESKLANLLQVKALLKRGLSYDSVSILAAPGSLGQSTVGTSSSDNTVTAAAASAATNEIGMNRDPRTELALQQSRANTPAEAVSAGAMGLSIANQGGAAAVPTSQTPAMADQMTRLLQQPDREKMQEESNTMAGAAADAEDEVGLPARSLFKRPIRG